MLNTELLELKGIDLKGRTSGEYKTVCPKCSQDRKNKKDPCLSVNITTGVYNCHNCDFKGGVFNRATRVYEKPVPRLEKLSPVFLKEFERRKISNNTLLRFGVTEGKEWMPSTATEMPVVCFNYLRGGETINIKFRGAGKAFKMAKDAELIFYNLDAIGDGDECVIVEGEIDCLSMQEAGIFNAVSVPNGASKGDQKLEYLDNCWEYFADKKKIVLAVDNDEAGNSLRDELARRLGKEKCWKVYYPEGCKDANEVLIKHGPESVKALVENAVQWPVEGILDVQDMANDIFNYYEHGYPQGFTTGITKFDELLTFSEGQLTIITGIPGSGKSEFIDWIMTRLSSRHGWGWAVCSFENQPSAIHATKLVEKFGGKAFGFRNNPIHRLTMNEVADALERVDQHFYFINLSEVDLTLNGLLSKAKELVMRKGIKGLLIDPWNYIEHRIPTGYSETQYISECLTAIKQFAIQNGVHVFLVAHPTKIRKNEMGKYETPTLYHISGSAHFFNKADNGIVAYRDFEPGGEVTIIVQKVRYSWLGQLGSCSFTYDTFTRQYKPITQ